MPGFDGPRWRPIGEFLHVVLLLRRPFDGAVERCRTCLIEQALEHIEVLLIAEHFCDIFGPKTGRICRNRDFSLGGMATVGLGGVAVERPPHRLRV